MQLMEFIINFRDAQSLEISWRTIFRSMTCSASRRKTQEILPSACSTTWNCDFFVLLHGNAIKMLLVITINMLCRRHRDEISQVLMLLKKLFHSRPKKERKKDRNKAQATMKPNCASPWARSSWEKRWLNFNDDGGENFRVKWRKAEAAWVRWGQREMRKLVDWVDSGSLSKSESNMSMGKRKKNEK